MTHQPIAPPQALIQLPNGSTAYFNDFNQPGQVLTPNFDLVNGFKRAMKVFLISYPEITASSPQFQKNKCKEYIDKIAQLYHISAQQFRTDQTLMADPFNEAKQESINISIRVKEFRGRNRLSNPRLSVKMNQKTIGTINLVAQANVFTVNLALDFDRLLDFRSDPKKYFILTVEGDTWVASNQPLNDFVFIISSSHPEGYEQWWDFGRGVQLLIQIEYNVPQEKNKAARDVSMFHLQTIKLILEQRLESFNRHLVRDTGHKQFCFKKRITFERPFVDPKTDEMFWSTPTLGLSLSPDSTRPERHNSVKYIDMQIGFTSSDQLVDKVCLCSEWCNWNSFFYHNPIYRFLMVRHTQLFMKNITNVPDMYLFMSIVKGCSPAYQKQPVLRLMYSANLYRKLYSEIYVRKSRMIKNLFSSAHPSPAKVDAVSYNQLRNCLPVEKICHQLDVNPFSDNCVENLLNYYKVLYDLHVLQTSYPLFVSDKRLWNRDLDLISRNKYREFIKNGYDICMANDLGGYDYLFTIDYEYENIFTDSDQRKIIQKIRENVLRKTSPKCPFNHKIILNDFLNTFAAIYRFLTKVEPILPTAHKSDALNEMFTCYYEMDSDFFDFKTNSNKQFIYRIDAIDSKYQKLEQNFYVFYTLKLYSYMFSIQKQCIRITIKYNSNEAYQHQVCENYDFIMDKSHIENIYSIKYPQNVVFEAVSDFFPVFEEFYTQFWGIPDHETVPIQSLHFIDVIDSALAQHNKLFVWWKNDGNNRRKFRKIIQQLVDSLENITNTSNEINEIWIMPAIYELSQDYDEYIEVFDELVYFLVKASCSMLFNTISNFFCSLHELQEYELAIRNISYTLSKPGWVPLIRTVNHFMDTIDDIKNSYIVFDSEFGRISDTCEQTKTLIKDIYRQLYAKIGYELFYEFDTFIKEVNVSSFQRTGHSIQLFLQHLAVGMSFVAAFVDEFRYEFNITRKRIQMFLMNPGQNVTNVLGPAQLNAAIIIVRDYLKDPTVVQNAMPYDSDVWTQDQYLLAIKNALDQLTPQQVNIDLIIANN